jgi:hypothetical protein
MPRHLQSTVCAIVKWVMKLSARMTKKMVIVLFFDTIYLVLFKPSISWIPTLLVKATLFPFSIFKNFPVYLMKSGMTAMKRWYWFVYIL